MVAVVGRPLPASMQSEGFRKLEYGRRSDERLGCASDYAAEPFAGVGLASFATDAESVAGVALGCSCCSCCDSCGWSLWELGAGPVCCLTQSCRSATDDGR